MNFETCAEALRAGYALRAYACDDTKWHFHVGFGRSDVSVPAGSVSITPITINGGTINAAKLADL